MFRRLLIAAALAGSFSAAAGAEPTQTVRSQAKIDPAALEAADRMLTAMDYDRMMERTCDAMVAQMGPMFKKSLEAKTGESVDDALVKRLIEIESEFLRGALLDSPNVRKAIATLYANAFSAAELNHLAELYRDPVMRKWTEVAPDMTAQTLPLIQGIVESHRDELEQKLVTAVTDYYATKGRTPDS
jgi:hypothetical protein